MPGAIYLCGTQGECARHGQFIYFCHDLNPKQSVEWRCWICEVTDQCHEEWEAKNPHTVQAIREIMRQAGAPRS